jgi:3-phenylpropionate/trans-cinnamate dioxygenase ferredoxin reductase subunit
MTDVSRVVIVGAGQAGCWAAKGLRQYDFAGEVILLGDEPYPPYDRPPLSKAVLLGDVEPRATWYLSPEELAEMGVDFRPGVRVDAINRADRTLELAGGESLGYNRLILATGARVRELKLPDSDGAPILYLRSMDDCLHLKTVLKPGAKVIVVGGGLIGLEVAAAARKLGAEAAVVEVAERVMARVVGPEISAHYEAMHRSHGVDVLCGVMPERIDSGADGCRLVCGDVSVEGTAIVAGIGVIPNSELAATAGLETEGGIWVDEYTRTADPAIHAAGDVTNHYHPGFGRRMRMETWQNAQNQGMAAGKIIAGREEPYNDTPWGWSDQYGVNLQMLGIPETFDGAIMRGRPEDGSFSLYYLKDGRLDAMAAVDAVRDVAVSRRLLAMKTELDPAALADTSVEMKSLMKR